MILNNLKLIEMQEKEFEKIKFRKLKLTLKKEITVNRKTDKEYSGFICGLFLASNPPHLPFSVRFIDESISREVNENIDPELATSINIFNIDRIELTK
jgi:hypothetical protein